MNNELHSLPEALAAEIRQLTSSQAPESQKAELSIGERLGQPLQAEIRQLLSRIGLAVEERLSQPKQQAEPAIDRAFLHVAQTTPELFVGMVLAHAGITSIELVETEETYEDKVVSLNNGGYAFTEVQPIVKRRTISRSVRFGTSDRATIGRLR